MKNFKTIIIVALVLGALTVIKLVYFKGTPTDSSPGPKGQGQPANVAVFVVSGQEFSERILVTGTVLANEEVELRPEASGKITQLLFKEGDKVSKGQLLVKINDADLRAQLKKLQFELKLAEEKESRQKKLLDIRGISQEEYDIALNELNVLKADIDFTMAQIAKTEVHAPFNGTVGLKSVSEGSYVSPTVKIATVQELDPVKIMFSIPEKYASRIRKGDVIKFTVQGGVKEEFEGKVYAIEPKIDIATRTLQVLAVSPNKERKIFPGAFANISFVLKSSSNTLLIPSEAVIPELKGQRVFIVKNGKAESVKVETGTRTDKNIEIISGLNNGDTLIVAGFMQLKPGSDIRITGVKK